MKIRRIASLLFAGALAVGLVGCGTAQSSATGSQESGKKLKVVTTIFPEYDWVNRVLGDQASNAEVTMLMDKGVDLHSFQPTVEDIAKVSSADVFVYVGGESDAWVKDALKNVTNPNQKTINLMEVLKDRTKPVEMKEGMQESDHDHDHGDAEHGHDHGDAEHDHDHGDADHNHDHDHESTSAGSTDYAHSRDGQELDEHVWLSLKNAKLVVDQIQKTLSEVDGAHASSYAQNAKSYTEVLDQLDQSYADAASTAKNKTLVFGDRFPFRYLVNDYGLDYFAAFEGCDAESEASFETVAFLSNKIKELQLPAVLTIEGETHKLAESIKQNTKIADLKVLTLDSMQSVKAQDVANGETYVNVMTKNLEIIKQALQ